MRFLTLAVAFMALPAFASQEFYVPPRSIELKMTQMTAKGENYQFTAEIKSLIGSLRDIKVYYEAVDGAKCQPASASVEVLAEDETRKFTFSVRIPEKLAAEPQSWVRFRVEYLPDYETVKSRIQADSVSYSDISLRNQLLEIVEKNRAAKVHAIDAIRHFSKKKS